MTDLHNPRDPFYDEGLDEDDATTGSDLDRALDALVAERRTAEPGLADVGAAALTGFTEEQARAVLASPRALRHLEVLWSLGGPAAAIRTAAQLPDERGRLHRRLLAAVGPQGRIGGSAAAARAGTGGEVEQLRTGPASRRPPRRLVTVLVGVAAALLLIAGGIAGITLTRRPAQPVAQSSATTAPATPAPSPTSAIAQLPVSPPLATDRLIVPRGIEDTYTQLYLISSSGKVIGRLGGPAGHRLFASTLSVDRRTVIYLDATAGTVRTMAADGSGDRVLIAAPPAGCAGLGHVAWDPVDQNLLVVQCVLPAGGSRLMVLALDGTVERVLDVGHAVVDDPTVSPDGKTVAYWAADDPPGKGGGSIYTIGIDGGKPVRLTRQPSGGDADPAWSPDGSRIAFRRAVPGNGFDVFVMAADGADQHPVVTGPARDRKPVWSPDGTRLAIISDRTDAGGIGPTMDLFVLDNDGSNLHRLGLPSLELLTPVWSRR